MQQSSPQKLQDVQPCSICIENKPNARINPCEHKFCYKCISRWSKKQSSCPICRQQFKEILTCRRRITVKPIVNIPTRHVRRTPVQMNTNMIFVPFPILGYPWNSSPFSYTPQFLFSHDQQQIQMPFFYQPFNNIQNLQISRTH